VAAWQQVLSIEHLYIVALLIAGFDVLFSSTFAAYLPALVPTSMLTAANSGRASSSAAASVLGPALAGALISIVGAHAAIAADGVSFVASILALASVRTTEPPPHPDLTRTPPLVAILQGWQWLLREPTLRAFAATAFTANFFYRVIMSVYILYLARDLGLPAATIGIIFGFGGGLGVLIGSLMAPPIARLVGVGRSMVAAHALFGVLGLPLAVSAFVPRYAAVLVFASEFLQLAVNAVYMGQSQQRRVFDSLNVRSAPPVPGAACRHRRSEDTVSTRANYAFSVLGLDHDAVAPLAGVLTSAHGATVVLYPEASYGGYDLIVNPRGVSKW